MIKNLLLSVILRQRVVIAKTLFLSVLVYFLVSIPPILLGKLVDQTIGEVTVGHLFYLIIFVVAFTSLGLERLFSFSLTAFSSRLIKDQYMQSVSEILEKERKLFEKIKIGEIIDLFSRFITGYEGVFTALISSLIPSILAVLILMFAILFVSNIIVLAVIITAQTILFCILLCFLRRYSNDLKQYTLSCYQLSDEWVEILGNNKIIQGEFSFAHALKRLDRFVSRMAKNFIDKSLSQDMVRSFVNFSQTLSLLIVIVVLVYYLKYGLISIGSIVTVITLNSILHAHMRVVSDFLVNIRNFRNSYNDFQRIRQVSGYLNSRGQVIHQIDNLNIKPIAIVKGHRPILTLEKEFALKRGEKICVLGISGAGKTTFFSMFFNANLEYQHNVFVNGIPISEINSENYQKLVRISFQENELLSGQGYSEWFQRDVDKKSAYELLSELHLPQDIIEGQRKLEPWSGNISGGEAKRLNVARLLICPGDVNVLDEPTTGLNVSLSKKTWEVVFKFLKYKTFLCSTHDLTYVNHFDRVLIIDDGKMVEDISPGDLENNFFFEKIRGKL